MTNPLQRKRDRVRAIADLLDIPPSYYEMARERYESLGNWLHRGDSKITGFDPQVYVQGSFRYGTVNRPILGTDDFDLDLVIELLVAKSEISQRQLKMLVGSEIKAYRDANGIKKPVEESKRCWKLEYSNRVKFHMDALPAIPDDEEFKKSLVALGVPPECAELAIAITDREHPAFSSIDMDWPRSNPRGFATWFEARMRLVAKQRIEQLVAKSAYASIEDVPPYEWKTPLQRAIQVLKRHRDVMFAGEPDLKPISMIITTLAAHAYRDEGDVYDALRNIVTEIPKYVRRERPRVPNPVDPAEDFADKWAKDPRLEKSFRIWHVQVERDLEALGQELETQDVVKELGRRFGVTINENQARKLADSATPIAQPATAAAPAIEIIQPRRPWADGR